MSRYCLILILVMIPFVSCKSLPQSEQTSGGEVSIPKSSGDISSFELEDGTLIIQSESEVFIDYALNSEISYSVLESTESYTYSQIRRPDGPITTLNLQSQERTVISVFEGLREGTVLKELTVSSSGATDSIILKSKEKEWTVPADTETVINWGDGDYIVYASRISLGKIEDQPPFRCNLILLKK